MIETANEQWAVTEEPYVRCFLCLLWVPLAIDQSDQRLANCMWCGNQFGWEGKEITMHPQHRKAVSADD